MCLQAQSRLCFWVKKPGAWAQPGGAPNELGWEIAALISEANDNVTLRTVARTPASGSEENSAADYAAGTHRGALG